jgi:hypothetical protein
MDRVRAFILCMMTRLGGDGVYGGAIYTHIIWGGSSLEYYIRGYIETI